MKKLICLLLMLACIGSCVFAEDAAEFEPWYDYGLGQAFPNPSSIFKNPVQQEPGHLKVNYDIAFMDELINVSSEDFEAYVNTLIELGYTNQAVNIGTGFDGTSEDGIRVVVFLDSTNAMSIQAQRTK